MDVLVMATNRPDEAEKCLESWQFAWHAWDRIVLVEDAPERSHVQRSGLAHLCWQDIGRLPEHAQWLVSRRDSAIKALGFLEAARLGAHRIYVLDDDCYPYSLVPISWTQEHCRNLVDGVEADRWRSSVEGLRVRGLPYGGTSGRVPVHLSMGLWSGIADVDAVTELSGGRPPEFSPPYGTWLAGPSYVPLCGMNFAFRVELLPLLYFPLMGEGQPFGRFDDIWAGIVAQRGMRHLGWHMSVGLPLVEHRRLSSPFRNLEREAPALEIHEHLWRVVDAAELRGTVAAEVAVEIGVHLVRSADQFPVERARGYVRDYGVALQQWASLAQAIIIAGSRP